MQKLGKELEFISFVQRDGSGVIPIGTPWSASNKHPKTDDMSYLDDDKFEVTIISMTNQTYIASGFRYFCCKIKTCNRNNENTYTSFLRRNGKKKAMNLL